MAEDLNLNGGVLADVGDLVPGQLTGEHHTGHAQVGAQLDAVQVVDGHLGGGVDGQVGGCLTQHPQHAQVLDQHRVHADLSGLGGQPGALGHLPVSEQGVEGEVHLHPSQMAVRNRRRKFLP